MSGISSSGDTCQDDHKAWQDSIHSSSTALNFLLTTGTHSDITFVVGKEGHQFRVHRLILSSRSPVFEDMLLLESSHSKPVISLKNDSPKAFQWLMHHIYLDKGDIDSIDLAIQILTLSDKYMIASAYDTCNRYLRTTVKRNNVLKLYKNLIESNVHSDILLSICRKIFSDNGNAVLMSKSLQDLSSNVLLQLLQEPLRVSSEIVIFKAFVTWANCQLKTKGRSTNPANIRAELSSLIPKIRFLTMTTEEFVQNILITEILTPEEVVHVLKYIARPACNPPISHDKSGCPLQISSTRETRLPLLKNEQIRTCICESPNRMLLNDRVFEFQMSTSDNIILLGVELALEGEGGIVELEIRKTDIQAPILARSESQTSAISFKNPVHIREAVTYNVRILLQDPNTFLYGLKDSEGKYSSDGFNISLSHGIFLHTLIFI